MFDRFDICEAYMMLESDWHIGGWLRERPSNQRRREAISVQLARMKFRCRPGLRAYEGLTENGKEIYNAAVRRWRLGAAPGATDRNPSQYGPMTLKEYEIFRAAVNDFFEENHLENLSTVDSDGNNEPFFSWRPCECCGSSLGGNRYTCEGYNAGHQEIMGPYDVCEDCVYFAEHGELDDTTMFTMTSGVLL